MQQNINHSNSQLVNRAHTFSTIQFFIDDKFKARTVNGSWLALIFNEISTFFTATY